MLAQFYSWSYQKVDPYSLSWPTMGIILLSKHRGSKTRSYLNENCRDDGTIKTAALEAILRSET